jgi:hypothetical protein
MFLNVHKVMTLGALGLCLSFADCGKQTAVNTESGTPATTPTNTNSTNVTPAGASQSVTLYLQGTTVQVQCGGTISPGGTPTCTNTPISVGVLVTQSGAQVTQVKSGSNGSFSIPILAGTYNIQIAPSSVPPDEDAVPQVATVTNATVVLPPLELVIESQ